MPASATADILSRRLGAGTAGMEDMATVGAVRVDCYTISAGFAGGSARAALHREFVENLSDIAPAHKGIELMV